MSRINCTTVRLGLRAALLVALLGLIVLLPVTVWAGGHVVNVPPPNGVNDTSNLQAALDTCVAYGKNCTVQLAAGNYLTSQLVAYNFHGTFKGKGKDNTTIEALPELEVNSLPERPPEEYGLCKPNTTDCLWPTLIMFVDGDIHVSDLAINVPSVPATTPYFLFGFWKIAALIDAVRFMGQYSTNASVERVAITGMPDNSDTGLYGHNVNNGAVFLGEFPRSQTPFDFYFLSGTFSVTDSYFKNVSSGTGGGAFLRDSRMVIGGSPTSGNVFEDVVVGVDLESIDNSVIEASYNNVAVEGFAGVYIAPWCCRVTSKPSLFLVHDNTLKPKGPTTDGMFLYDDPANNWIQALIYNNIIEAQDIGYGGISAYNTNGTTIRHNKISGNGADGIGIWNGSHAQVLKNDVTNFTASPDLAQIVLDGTTAHSTVVCKTSRDTAMNLGTDNQLIGCQQLNSSVNASKLSSRPILKTKPLGR